MRFQVVLQVKGSIAGKRQWATPGRPDPPQTAGDRLKTARERSQEQGGKAGAAPPANRLPGPLAGQERRRAGGQPVRGETSENGSQSMLSLRCFR